MEEERTLEQRVEDLEAKLVSVEGATNVSNDASARLYAAVRDLQQKVKNLETTIANMSQT
jgi:uncharacterized coiled-coil DUF342 family protein